MKKPETRIAMVLNLGVVLMLTFSAKADLVPVDGASYSAVGFPWFWLAPGPFSLSRQIDRVGMLLDFGFWSLVAWFLFDKALFFRRKVCTSIVCTLFAIYLIVLWAYFEVYEAYFGSIEWSKISSYGPSFGIL